MIVYLLDIIAGDGQTQETAYRPAILDAGILAIGDTCTDQPTSPQYLPDPNLVVVQIGCQQQTIDAIVAHPDYGAGAILYDLPNPFGPNDKPPAAEFGLRRSYCARLGMSNARFTALFGTNANPKTRKDGADSLTAWVKTLPKGKDK